MVVHWPHNTRIVESLDNIIRLSQRMVFHGPKSHTIERLADTVQDLLQLIAPGASTSQILETKALLTSILLTPTHLPMPAMTVIKPDTN